MHIVLIEAGRPWWRAPAHKFADFRPMPVVSITLKLWEIPSRLLQGSFSEVIVVSIFILIEIERCCD